MEDITQGVLAICGNSGARNEVAKKMKVGIVFKEKNLLIEIIRSIWDFIFVYLFVSRLQVADGKVRKALIRDDVKTELQRRFFFQACWFLTLVVTFCVSKRFGFIILLQIKLVSFQGLSQSAWGTTWQTCTRHVWLLRRRWLTFFL